MISDFTIRTCVKCNTAKKASEFTKSNKPKNWCKKCLYTYQTKRWNRKKTILVNLAGRKCHKCGKVGHPAIFDFHHLDPNNKKFAISSSRRLPLKELIEESKKCVLLCACCHRLQHIVDDCWDFDFNSPNFLKKTIIFCKCGKKLITGKLYCSQICSQKANEVIEWPSNLPELVTNSSARSVANLLGVSDKAVAKRLKKHH